MRIKILLLLSIAVMFGFVRCDQEKKTDKEIYREILTSRTLGLAYLEENKLEEAETEFLKLTTLAPDEAMGFANLGLVYLRMGKHEEAIEKLQNAIDIESDNPDIRLILAKIYEVSGQLDKSLDELNDIIQIAPDHVKTLYSLAEFYAKNNDSESLQLRQKYLTRIVEKNPENIVPKLYLTELLIRIGETEDPLKYLEEIQQQFPAFPDEAISFFNKAIELLKQSKSKEALTAVRIFHNFLKVSSPYQAGILELKGPGGELIGFPVITIGDAVTSYIQEGESILETIKYSDVTSTVGLDFPDQMGKDDLEDMNVPGTLALGDYDGDGDQDIYVSSNLINSKGPHIFRNDMGTYTDIIAESGISHRGIETDAIFADYDNDGHLDLFILMKNGSVLYRNQDNGEFKDVTDETNTALGRNNNVARFVDLEHDGDLDIFIGRNGVNQVFRNNADGTFTEQARQMGLAGEDVETIDVAYGDFDDDGDIDLYLVNRNAPDILYTNLREGVFKDILDESGIEQTAQSIKVSVGDYNNDGYIDIFLIFEGGDSHSLYTSKRDGTFEKDLQNQNINKLLAGIDINDADLLDFDNDGSLDILVSGNPSNDLKKSLVLLHNDGWAQFEDVSRLLPEDLGEIYLNKIADFNEDGDLDIYSLTGRGKIKLLRNDGGNANHYLKIQLVGLRTGSSKNNHFGIGSKVEVRAGDLYQMKVVTDPNVHFGLGGRSQADVVRIVWTNGVPQNLFTPKSDQDLIEEQELKGSCPFLYTWNGEEFVFVKDIMWRSALGMPLGIMGGENTYAFPDASKEYIKIDGELLQPRNGKYILQVTAELWETIYFDEVRLIAVDHPENIDFVVDEKFTQPPFPELKLYVFNDSLYPKKVFNDDEINLFDQIYEKDDQYITHFKREKYQGMTEMRELFLDLGDNIDIENLYLFLRGWIFPTDASINVAISQSKDHVIIPPYLQVLDENLNWVTVIENMGFPMGKDKTVVVNLEDIFISDQRKIRILTNMEIYWDHIFYGYYNKDLTLKTTEMKALSANIHYRGYSKMFRKGGIYGPHWFDYRDVSKEGKWRDLIGSYTRYGDVTELLEESDNMYIITNAGDEVTIEFDANMLPDLPDGWERDFLIYSVGWVKDGDLNTAFGNTVEPLPFHGMTNYPYKSDVTYPSGKEIEDYMEKYNTRIISTDQFKHALSGLDR